MSVDFLVDIVDPAYRNFYPTVRKIILYDVIAI